MAAEAEAMEVVEEEILRLSASELAARTRQLENELRDRKSEATRLQREIAALRERTKENADKIKMNKQLPYLVATAVEVLDERPEGDENDDDEALLAGLAAVTSDKPLSVAASEQQPQTQQTAAPKPKAKAKKGKKGGDEAGKKAKCVVIKTSTRQTVYLPVVGLVDPLLLRPGDLVGVNKDSYLLLERLPPEYDARVKAMEVDERPQEEYSDIGGLDKQIQELVEAVVLPMTHRDRFEAIGVHPPKGVLLYGPPGTGKTLMARACAAQTKATFLKLAGPQLVQMFIGDGAKLVRDAFALAKEKGNAIIFIDELDAVGAKRHDSEMGGDREVQRTMLELLNQMDGFSSTETIKVIAATNRVDILDPALLRSGRLDRKIELPLPTEEARSRILQIHSRKMNVGAGVNFEELARMTPDFNGAQLKAVCVEAGMLALRRDATELSHEDYVEGIAEVQAKKKKSLEYFA